MRPTPATGGPGTPPATSTGGTAGSATPPMQTAGTTAMPGSGAGGAVAAPAGSGGNAQAGASADSSAEAGSGGSAAMAGTMSMPDPGAPRPSAGCAAGAIKAGHTNETIQIGGAQRQYVQHVPMSYDGKKPFALMLDFHGGTYDGPRCDARASNKFKAMSETEQFLYIAPTGLGAWWTTTDARWAPTECSCAR